MLFILFPWFLALKNGCLWVVSITNITMTVSSSKLTTRFCCNLTIVSFKFSSYLGKFNVRRVESIAVGDYFGNISMKLSWSHILIRSQVVLYRGKVHWLRDDFLVVRNSKGNGVNRLSKRPWSLAILEHVKNPNTWTQGLANMIERTSSIVFLDVVFLIGSIFNFLWIFTTISFLTAWSTFSSLSFWLILSILWHTFAPFFLPYVEVLADSFAFLTVLAALLRGLVSNWKE